MRPSVVFSELKIATITKTGVRYLLLHNNIVGNFSCRVSWPNSKKVRKLPHVPYCVSSVCI